jgi:hypothetical protein
MTELDWSRVAEKHLEDHPASRGTEVIQKLKKTAPKEITEALDPEVAEIVKAETTAFLLSAIRDAVADHALTDAEMQGLSHMQRVFRIEEGDLLQHHPDEVAWLLSQELERLLEDQEIDPKEAVHETKLQELLGLGYDQFIALTAPEIEAVILDLLHALDRVEEEGTEAEKEARVRERLRALSTIYKLNTPNEAPGPRSGYLYLLMNPAMPGLVKVGMTGREPKDRVAELTSATGVPTPFVLVYEVFVQDAPAAEAWVHSELSNRGKRSSENREFFAVAPSEAVELMMNARNAVALG